MTEPRRLLDEAGTSEAQRSLLGSFSKEAARPEARERTLAALGLPAAIGGASIAGAATKASSAAAAKGALGLASWFSWGGALLAMALVGAGASGTAYVVATRSAPTPHASSAAVPRTQEPVQQPRVTTSPAVTDTAAPELPTLAPESLPLAADAKPRATTAPRPASAPSSSTLMEELTLMDRARQSFAQGSYGDAVRAVSSYEARYPNGSFVQEAEFIRVRSLYEQHDDGAAAAARSFLTRYPTSPYAPRVRTLVGGGP